MKSLIEKLKTKWHIESDLDFFLIMVVFSCAGMGVSLVRKPLFSCLGLAHASLGIKVFVSILFIIPLYQLSTLVFALPLGQFNFFFQRQKEFVRFLGRPLSKFLRQNQKI